MRLIVDILLTKLVFWDLGPQLECLEEVHLDEKHERLDDHKGFKETWTVLHQN